MDLMPQAGANEVTNNMDLSMQQQNAQSVYDYSMKEEINYQKQVALTEHKARVALYKNHEIQKQKLSEMEIVPRIDSVYLKYSDGNGKPLKRECVCNCAIKEVRKFLRVPTRQFFWQICIVDILGNTIESPLYEPELLESITKLRRTILNFYVTYVSAVGAKQIWTWLQKVVIHLYEETPPKMIPSKGGWFELDKSMKFYTANNTDEILQTEEIKDFVVSNYQDESIDSIKPMLEMDEENPQSKQVATLLMIRIMALLGRIISSEPCTMGVILIGQNAEQVAASLLTTDESQAQFVNLDADRISKVRERAIGIQDNSLLFICCAPNEKSAQNRIRDVFGWLNTGYIEGQLVSVPYIFCFKALTRTCSMNDLIVLDVSDIKTAEYDKAFAVLQSLIVATIESSGKYWISQLRNTYLEHRAMGETPAIALVSTIADIVVSMLFPNNNNADGYWLKRIFVMGQQEIQRQLLHHEGGLVEVFHDDVIKLVGSGKIVLEEREHCHRENDRVLYYDKDYYYITKSCMRCICEDISLDAKSMLCLKQWLVEEGIVKTYNNCGSHNRDLEVDFITYNAYGERKKRSGIAIKQSFFDKIGGLKLYERGDIL